MAGFSERQPGGLTGETLNRELDEAHRLVIDCDPENPEVRDQLIRSFRRIARLAKHHKRTRSEHCARELIKYVRRASSKNHDPNVCFQVCNLYISALRRSLTKTPAVRNPTNEITVSVKQSA